MELADLTTTVGVRDSKAPNSGHLTVSRSALATLFGEIKGHKFDL